MKDYIKTLIEDEQLTILDKRIEPGDELYDLEKEYNVQISRSQSSDAVYVKSNKTNKRIRIGHYITERQKEWHIKNWTKNYISRNVNYDNVKKNLDKAKSENLI